MDNVKHLDPIAHGSGPKPISPDKQAMDDMLKRAAMAGAVAFLASLLAGLTQYNN